MLPFILAKSNNRDIKKAKIFGENFGIIYQIADDFSDSNRSFKETGKIPGKDIKKGKRTLISKIGKAQALDLCYTLAEEATKDKNIFGNDKYNFKKMIFNIVEGIKIK
jgi:geranylgeranyl pyrophosphate synthase